MTPRSSTSSENVNMNANANLSSSSDHVDVDEADLKQSHFHRKAKIGGLESLICGGIAGITTRVFVAPFDVVKLRMQLHERIAGRHMNPIEMCVSIIKNDGITGFWKGNWAGQWMYLFYSGFQFAAFYQINQLINPFNINPTLQNLIAGAGSAAIGMTFSYPFDLLRTRFALQSTKNSVYQSLFRSLCDIPRQETWKGLFRGLRPGLISIVPQMSLFFAFYEPIHDVVGINATNLLSPGKINTLSGFLAGIMSKTAVFPLDTIRRHLQIQGPTRAQYVVKGVVLSSENPSTWACGKAIFARSGIKGFYQGLSVALLKAAPSSAVSMWAFEYCLSALHRIKNKNLNI